MSISNHCLPPSSSLPPIRHLLSATKVQISSALLNLQAIYCPLRLPKIIPKGKQTQSAYVDSGYVSEDEVAEDDVPDADQILTALRTDEFERNYAVRWLTGLISRAELLPFDDEERADIIDEASFILSSFSEPSDGNTEDALTRDFSFPTSLSQDPVAVCLNDAPLSGTDHTDVGLQSWGASIVFSGLMCTSPEQFGLDHMPVGANIIELGAGTGLISLTLAKLIPLLPVVQPSITATDYHPTVLDNLRLNITTNFPAAPVDASPVKTMLLDWSAPPAALRCSAHLLFAADVVYAPEHGVWLRDCAAHLLAPNGVFWLVVTIRSTGKFEGIPDTAEAAFARSDCPKGSDGRVLKILEKQVLAKQKGVGRGDESGYMLFRIGWCEC